MSPALNLWAKLYVVLGFKFMLPDLNVNRTRFVSLEVLFQLKNGLYEFYLVLLFLRNRRP